MAGEAGGGLEQAMWLLSAVVLPALSSGSAGAFLCGQVRVRVCVCVSAGARLGGGKWEERGGRRRMPRVSDVVQSAI